MRWLLVLLFACKCLHTALSARILALCGVVSHSHSLWCYKYMSLLAERGHHITVFGVDKPKFQIANLTTFIVEGAYDAFSSSEGVEEWSNVEMSKLESIYIGLRMWDEMGSSLILRSAALQDLIKHYKHIKKPFDLIIHDNGGSLALLGLVPTFANPPLILATTFGTPQWMTSRVGNIFNPAYIPTMIMEADQNMDFYQRCVNTFYWLFLEIYYQFLVEPFQDRLMIEVFGFGSDSPHVRDIASQANIAIVNHDFALNGPKPLVPGVIGIAGLHVTDPKPLPQDIDTFIAGTKDGAILLSFGTNIQSFWFPKGFEQMVVSALSKIPQRVLWKWDKPVENISPNVMISKWLPQGDMLVHPNMRLFITHCGLLSVQEAILRKVPMLAMPVFLDQQDNAKSMVRKNITIMLDFRTLTEVRLINAINEILTNPMYKRNIEVLGELMRDQPQSARDKAVFWTEYALRHEGAPHLRSASADMPYYQLLLLDILAMAIAAVMLTSWMVVKLLSTVRKLFKPNAAKSKRD